MSPCLAWLSPSLVTDTEKITVKNRSRYRLRMGFKNDFEIIEVHIIRIEPVKIDQEERIEWIAAKVPVKRFRIRTSVVLGLFGLFAAGVGLIS